MATTKRQTIIMHVHVIIHLPLFFLFTACASNDIGNPCDESIRDNIDRLSLFEWWQVDDPSCDSGKCAVSTGPTESRLLYCTRDCTSRSDCPAGFGCMYKGTIRMCVRDGSFEDYELCPNTNLFWCTDGGRPELLTGPTRFDAGID